MYHKYLSLIAVKTTEAAARVTDDKVLTENEVK